eukprot:7116421-Alexandrium_andersonii.AAC.1
MPEHLFANMAPKTPTRTRTHTHMRASSQAKRHAQTLWPSWEAHEGPWALRSSGNTLGTAERD